MKDKIFSRLTVLMMMVFSLASASCSKDGDDDDDMIDPTEEQLPINRQDAEAKIKGKWDVAASGEVRSIEFIEGNTYILEVDASSSLAARKTPLSSRAALARSGGGLKAETAETGSTERLSGKFTVSADGQSVMLDDIAQITISGISEESFTFTITFTGDDRRQNVTATIVSAVDITSRTALLTGNWGFAAWAEFDLPNRSLFESRGYRPQDQGLQFTGPGTMIMRYINFIQSSSVNPETGQVSEVVTVLGLAHDIYSWKWKDSEQTTVTVTRGNVTFDIIIEHLTLSGLNAKLAHGTTWAFVPM